MAAVPADACVGKDVSRQRAETESIVEFAKGEQSRNRGDERSAKLQQQPAVEIKSENGLDALQSHCGFCMREDCFLL